MATEITVPRLGWSMDEGRLVEWLKQPGESVSRGEMLYVLEGDKAAQEIESFDAGLLFLPPDAPVAGDMVRVGQRLGYLLAAGESPPSPPATGVSEEESIAQQQLHAPAGPAARRLARELHVDLSEVAGTGPHGRITTEDIRSSLTFETLVMDGRLSTDDHSASLVRQRATPRARRLARELDVSVDDLVGSGRGGRIRACDILESHQRGGKSNNDRLATSQGFPITQFRRTIAQRMMDAVQNAAPVTLTTRVCVERLVSLRQEYQSWQRPDAIVPSYTELFIKLVGTVLQDHLGMIDQWRDNCLFRPSSIDIGFAVQTPQGLLAPVIRQVPASPLMEISRRARNLIETARQNRLASADLQNGVFTVTNLGAFGIDAFTPLLNVPQSAILGLGRIAQEPAVVQGVVVPQWQSTLSLTFDHRIIDGAPAAQFLQDLCRACQNPLPALLTVG